MDALEAIKTRRSTRLMSPEIPERELLDQIIQAGRLAPSGSNSQTTHFIVITNKELLAEIAGVVMAEFAKMEVTEDTYVSLKHSIVGYPADGKLQREPLPRKGNPVTWIE